MRRRSDYLSAVLQFYCRLSLIVLWLLKQYRKSLNVPLDFILPPQNGKKVIVFQKGGFITSISLNSCTYLPIFAVFGEAVIIIFQFLVSSVKRSISSYFSCLPHSSHTILSCVPRSGHTNLA